jgi:DNA (cytosine-5)-methyltransferase 3A
MNVLSLFDGMSCGQIALKQLGIIPEVYYASEIDKHAIKQTQLNFPNTIQLGDVTQVDVSKLEPIGLLIGGSPCQSFSFAGKRVGMSTTDKEEIYTLDRYLELKEEGFQFEGESYLFWEYMRILTDIRQYNPNVLFLLENVEMGKKWERVLSEAIGVYGVHINSALVSAQNRKRIYWTNIRTKRDGLFNDLYSNIPQPADKGILLKDILEDEVDEKYYLSNKAISGIMNHKQRQMEKRNGFGAQFPTVKSNTLLARCYKDGKENLICVAQRRREAYCLTPKRTEYGKKIRKDYEAGKIKEKRRNVQQLEPRFDGKTNCLTSVQKDNLIMGDVRVKGFSYTDRGIRPHRGDYRKSGVSEYGTILYTDQKSDTHIASHVGMIIEKGAPLSKRHNANYKSADQKANAFLSTSHKGSQANGMTLARGIIQLNPSKDSGGVQPYQQDRIYDVNGIAPALCSGHGGMGCNVNTDRIRRLTPTECARLQTIPDWYKWECSDTQQYRMLGNGWTVDVIAHILSFIKEKLNINVA